MNILMGISGSIAAYKTPELCRLFNKAGFNIKVVLTKSAKEFVTPLTLKTLTNNQVYTTDSLENINNNALLHIELARWADFVLIAPTTANIMAKLTIGLADDLLTSICLATQAPIILAPSMNIHMWENQATQYNAEALKTRGFQFLGPDVGEQACGDTGSGRLIDLQKIVEFFIAFQEKKIWAGKTILITAGPTIEPIDPVRYISNYSSGKMGYALARTAQLLGAEVILISGPTVLEKPKNIQVIDIKTAQAMFTAIKENISDIDVFIGAAAVADWKITREFKDKIKDKSKNITLEFTANPDIISTINTLNPKVFVIGFAAETSNIISYAKEKLATKNLNAIIANNVSQPDIGFSNDNNAVTLLTHNTQIDFPKMPKETLSLLLLKELFILYSKK